MIKKVVVLNGYQANVIYEIGQKAPYTENEVVKLIHEHKGKLVVELDNGGFVEIQSNNLLIIG